MTVALATSAGAATVPAHATQYPAKTTANLQRAVTSAPALYTVQSGDTLSSLAQKWFGSSAKWPELYGANQKTVGSNPDALTPGDQIKRELGPAVYQAQHAAYQGQHAADANADPTYQPAHAAPPAPAMHQDSSGGNGQMTPQQVGNMWIEEGGSPAAEQTAECIAFHESSDNPQAVSPSDDWGLYQINHGGQAMLNAEANTRRAIEMSNNGSNWESWSTAPDCT